LSCWSAVLSCWNKIAEQKGLDAKMIGYPIRMKLQCFDSDGNESESLKALILQELIKKGIFISPGVIFLSYSHSQGDIDMTLESFRQICEKIVNFEDKNYEKFLEGNKPKKVWSMKIPSTKGQ